MSDFIQVIRSGTAVTRQYMSDDVPEGNVAHIDAVQCIPEDGYPDWVRRACYALAEISDVSLTLSSIYSAGTLQGFTGFDGIFKNISADQVVINLASPHKVVFNGLISGSFSNLWGPAGSAVPVNLFNARVGGVPKVGAKAYACNILHFMGMQYEKVKTDSTIALHDYRGYPNMSSSNTMHVSNLCNFKLASYRAAVAMQYAELIKLPSANFYLELQNIAKEYGDAYE